MPEQRQQDDDGNRDAQKVKKDGSHGRLLLKLKIALAATVSGGEAGGEGCDQQRDEEPQRRVRRSLAGLVGRFLGRGDRLVDALLGLGVQVGHAFFCVLLAQARAPVSYTHLTLPTNREV